MHCIVLTHAIASLQVHRCKIGAALLNKWAYSKKLYVVAYLLLLGFVDLLVSLRI